jgi:hypothetical protein
MDITHSDKLRWLASYLDTHPALAELTGKWDYPTLWLSVEDMEKFQEVIKTMGGFEKSGSMGTLTARHRKETTDGTVIYSVSVNVSGVCEAVPKVDNDGQPVLRKKRTYVETDEYEQEIEYKCPEVWTS